MHSRVDIALVSGLDEAVLVGVVERMQVRIAEIERVGNCFDPYSELSRLNRDEVAREDVSEELARILSLCDEWKAKTAGLFDVAYSGTINLSGFLKGYALDEVRPIIEEAGIADALINLGNSSILALGCQPGYTDGWHISALNSSPPSDGAGETLHNQCLTTSGNDTADRCHIVNPITGQLIKGLRQVSVITYSGAEGEVMATVKFIKANGIPTTRSRNTRIEY